jgi:hypothetical protein
MIQAVIDELSKFTRENWLPGMAQRFGNTKTHGVVRGEFTVLPDLPNHLLKGAQTRSPVCSSSWPHRIRASRLRSPHRKYEPDPRGRKPQISAHLPLATEELFGRCTSVDFPTAWSNCSTDSCLVSRRSH